MKEGKIMILVVVLDVLCKIFFFNYFVDGSYFYFWLILFFILYICNFNFIEKIFNNKLINFFNLFFYKFFIF